MSDDQYGRNVVARDALSRLFVYMSGGIMIIKHPEAQQIVRDIISDMKAWMNREYPVKEARHEGEKLTAIRAALTRAAAYARETYGNGSYLEAWRDREYPA